MATNSFFFLFLFGYDLPFLMSIKNNTLFIICFLRRIKKTQIKGALLSVLYPGYNPLVGALFFLLSCITTIQHNSLAGDASGFVTC